MGRGVGLAEGRGAHEHVNLWDMQPVSTFLYKTATQDKRNTFENNQHIDQRLQTDRHGSSLE